MNHVGTRGAPDPLREQEVRELVANDGRERARIADDEIDVDAENLMPRDR